MASYRHIARIAVMQTIFAYEFRGGEPMEILKYNLQDYASKLKDVTFAEALLEGMLQKKDDLIKVIQEEAPEWPVDKIAPVDRAILELGTYEIIYSEDVPPIVAINEAVEVAKTFGDTNSPKFINGVLSTIMHKYRKDATNKPPVVDKKKGGNKGSKSQRNDHKNNQSKSPKIKKSQQPFASVPPEKP